MIRCLVFDVDGTLVPSNGIKRHAYAQTVAANPAAATRVDAIASDVALDRYEVFNQLCAEFPDAGDPLALADHYAEICHAQVLPLFQDGPTRALIEGLRDAGLQSHIATAAPLTAITRLLDAADLTRLFASVHGRPQVKPDAVAEIRAAGSLDPAEIAVIGDGDNDRAAAAANGCHFVHVAGDAHELYAASPASGLAFLANALQTTFMSNTAA